MTASRFGATLTRMKPTERLAMSERVIFAWEEQDRPGGAASDNLRLIEEELAKLLEIGTGNADLAERVDAVAYRYRLMQEKLKLGLN